MAGASSDEEDVISAINVTPLVDITLVLLIIFMVTAKIIVAQGLPKAASGETIQTIFSVELTADGRTRVDSKWVSGDDAVGGLAKRARQKNRDLRAVIRADRKVEHGRVIHVLDLLKRSGIAKIAFAVSPLQEGVDIDTSKPK
jgi:biopolymer transport protein ExbD